MRISSVITSIAATAPLIHAHGVHLPGIEGLAAKDVRVRGLLESLNGRSTFSHGSSFLEARQDDPKECGEGIGSCPDGECCSSAGFCGTTDDHCYSPRCQYQYGPGCAENNPPKGVDTTKFKRNKAGKVPYGGTGIYRCVKNNTVALTYDDGPQHKFTTHILDLFNKYDAKGTFFVTGNNINKGAIDTTDEFVKVIKRMDEEGHQIASHTWTHLDLSKISSKERENQMVYLERALHNIVGKIPTYMRPPYSSCTADSGCEQHMADLGYHVSYFNLDTDDYNHNISDIPKKLFEEELTSTGDKNDPWLAIAHDIVEHTAMDLTEFMLETVTKAGYKLVTMGECLGDPKGNWYRTENGTAYVADDEYPAQDLPDPSTSDNTSTMTSGANPSGTAASATNSAVPQESGDANPPADPEGAANAASLPSSVALFLAAIAAYIV